MTYITSYPLNVIKKLIKHEFAEHHPEYQIELGALNISDDALDTYEDECDNTMQTLKVQVHVNSSKENDPAQCWHPWTLYWNCEDSEFENIMRDDQVEYIRINESLNDLKDVNEAWDIIIDHAPIKAVDFRQLIPTELLSVESERQFNMPDGTKNYTIKQVLEFIVNTVAGLTLNERFAGQDIWLLHLNVHDSGIIYPCFSLEPDDEDEE